MERFKKAVEYFSAASKPRSPNMGPSAFICKCERVNVTARLRRRAIQDASHYLVSLSSVPGFGPNPFGGPPGHLGPMQPGKNQVD